MPCNQYMAFEGGNITSVSSELKKSLQNIVFYGYDSEHGNLCEKVNNP